MIVLSYAKKGLKNKSYIGVRVYHIQYDGSYRITTMINSVTTFLPMYKSKDWQSLLQMLVLLSLV